MARAKRERVVQDEVEKANRRPTDPTRPTRHPSLLLWNLTIFDETPYLKINHFRRKLGELRRTPFLKINNFSTKNCEYLQITSWKVIYQLPISMLNSGFAWNGNVFELRHENFSVALRHENFGVALRHENVHWYSQERTTQQGVNGKDRSRLT